MSHSILRPSSAEKWVNCGASVMSEIMATPRASNKKTIAGKVAHKIAAELIEGLTVARQAGKEVSARYLDTVIDGILVTQEITNAVLLYVRDVEKTMKYARVFGGKNIGIEKRVEITPVHVDCGGTPDCFIYDKDEDALHVWGFEFGHGVVEVFENYQMLLYAIGICYELEIEPSNIFLTVVQPRAPHKKGPVRIWHLKGGFKQLRTYRDRLMVAAQEALSPEALCVTGSHCRDCKGLADCETNRRATLSAVDMVSQFDRYEISENNKWYELFILERVQERIKHRIIGLKLEIELAIKQGRQIPGYKLEPTMSNLSWKGDKNEIVIDALLEGVTLVKEPQLITPTQAKNQGVSEDFLNKYAEKKQTGVKLVAEDFKETQMMFGFLEGRN